MVGRQLRVDTCAFVSRVSVVVLGIVASVGLGATSTACSSKGATATPPQSPGLTSAQTQASQVFRFSPPDGTEFVRTDRRKQELAIVGAPIRSSTEDEMQWKVGIRKSGDQYRIKQDLMRVSLKRDGKTIAQGNVKEGISAELLVDRDGNLVDVKGLDQTAARLRALAAPGQEATVAQVFTPQYLKDHVTTRYNILYGETIGRQATPGATWTINNPPGSFVASRKVTVERLEPCGNATCARLQEDFKVDPRVLMDSAVALVKSRAQDLGADPSKVTASSASYGMSGAMLLEPSTMLNHGAALTSVGKVTVAGPNQQQFDVEMNGTTELTYAYGPAPVATGPELRSANPTLARNDAR